MTKKSGMGEWKQLGLFITRRNQGFIARTPEQFKHAKRLKWRQIEGKRK